MCPSPRSRAASGAKKVRTKRAATAKTALKKPAPKGKASTPSTATTKLAVATVEGVEGQLKALAKPVFTWVMEAGLDTNFARLGSLLASLPLALYRHPEGGLLVVEDGRAVRISTAKELAPMLVDNVRIHVFKNGKYHGEKPSAEALNSMLSSRSFLSHFKSASDVVTTPIVLSDFTASQPGHNAADSILYLGEPSTVIASYSAAKPRRMRSRTLVERHAR